MSASLVTDHIDWRLEIGQSSVQLTGDVEFPLTCRQLNLCMHIHNHLLHRSTHVSHCNLY